jgi:hypothetical protein
MKQELNKQLNHLTYRVVVAMLLFLVEILKHLNVKISTPSKNIKQTQRRTKTTISIAIELNVLKYHF